MSKFTLSLFKSWFYPFHTGEHPTSTNLPSSPNPFCQTCSQTWEKGSRIEVPLSFWNARQGYSLGKGFGVRAAKLGYPLNTVPINTAPTWTYRATVQGSSFDPANFDQANTVLPVAGSPVASVPVLPTDPRFGSQWHLHNVGQTGGTVGMDLNVVRVWSEYTGRGVRVGVIDDGFQYTHPDLDGNYDATLDWDGGQEDADPLPVQSIENHGTAAAGVIVAEAGNSLGGVGVAYGAKISGMRLDFQRGGYAQIADALARMAQFDVVNNSWGFISPYTDDFTQPAFQPHAIALQNAIHTGRNGLGTVVVFAAGNARPMGDNANYYSHQNSRYTIAVAAVNHHGVGTAYSNPGANLLVSAFGGDGVVDGIGTTDRQGAAGYSPGGFTPRFGGTSAAAPMVTGIVALMLEANPNLGYRDVQEILAYSARQNDRTSSSWAFNGATNWNGGGLRVSHDYGFGLVDALAAVRLAETWMTTHTAANEQTVAADRSSGLAIVGESAVSDVLAVTEAIAIDRIEITLDITHPYSSDLEVVLRSPHGTESTLLTAAPVVESPMNVNFTFSSTHFWGETSVGEWTLRVRDTRSSNTGILNRWTLRLYGDSPSLNQTYFYTNEFANCTDAARHTLTDLTGTDTLNAAAVSSSLRLNLNPGTQSLIANNTLTLDQDTVIENAFGGDAGDGILGNSAANTLNGMRGRDWLAGGEGNDTVLGGRGADTLWGEQGSDRLTGGLGRDSFIFSSDSAVGVNDLGMDWITDFMSGPDKIVLDKTLFSSLNSIAGNGFSQASEFATVAHDAEAATSSAQIVYSQASGTLFYNANGNANGWGSGGSFATLVGRPTLVAADFVLWV